MSSVLEPRCRTFVLLFDFVMISWTMISPSYSTLSRIFFVDLNDEFFLSLVGSSFVMWL